MSPRIRFLNASQATRLALAIGVALAAAWVASACAYEPQAEPATPDAAGGPHIVLQTDRQVYGVGETILLTIENNLDSPISYYDGCSLRRCGHLDGEWGCIWKECHGQTLVLEPRRSVQMQQRAHNDLGARQAFEFDCQIVSRGAPYTARSSEFLVE
jgi:hypothetical protein